MPLSRRAVLSTVLPGALSSVFLESRAQPAVPVVRVGIVPFGTGSWELDVARRNGFDVAQNVAIKPVELANTAQTLVALQRGDVDVVLQDWLWVVGRQAEGEDWTYSPVSCAAGALVTRPDSSIGNIGDLKTMRVGLVNPVEKNWLILEAYAKRKFGIDLEQTVKKTIATPPSLLKQLIAGDIDSMVTFWLFAAKAEADGMKRVISVEEAVRELGIEGNLPFTGYVFSRAWAERNRSAIDGFLAAGRKARALLETSDDEWLHFRSLIDSQNDGEFQRLRVAYRNGIVHQPGEAQRRTIAQLYRTMAEIGGLGMVGASSQIPATAFWD